ncbi:Ras family GTPase [Entamoeba histolytica HM-1:IMSS-B]|uniref:Ras family GTPase n=6 Tax=Entamoeba histolytica TaxID=5759 RepID=C4LU06_ENTH1|nr:Ras family GTPase [Entamoeba histolytica HM-1:IMSS]EMD42431.1 Ras family gtpase [Entamoeba histolytica KU27]EMH75493.1 Ras family GTPase [Entamoeba histolytica HM-1:IMSS-B]EMS12104.1 Ras family GTPase [Entamoeba histolytica HM-3:IMSS]ENY60053.1 Ras family GTPase, putative [Entamoeba histolytica HM-1:IMSS-A]GAT92072.1 Ras family GTPase [Entamoeba histolytica]|eukprot:XP_656759.1 Ras family GTPase [Entamoeba histolytica HM-1:IMSS]
MTEEYKVELIRVMVLGDGGVGKSVLTIQFTMNMFVEEYDPTVENCYRKNINVDGKVCVLDILDTAGREEYQTMIDPYIRQTNSFLIVYSIVDEKTFETAKKYVDKILRTKEDDHYHQIVLVGNKIDLNNERTVQKEKGLTFAQEKGIGFNETSAKKRINVDETFQMIVKRSRENKISSNDNETTNKKRKCLLL